MKINDCKCGSIKRGIKYGNPCDFGQVKCFTCGAVGPVMETNKDIIIEWNKLNEAKP